MEDNKENFTLGLVIGLIIGFVVSGFIFKAIGYKSGQINCIEGIINFEPQKKTYYIWKD